MIPSKTFEDDLVTDRAVRLAIIAHTGQTRKYTGEPYVIHPCRVAMTIRAIGGDTELQAAALLHDVIEDSPGFTEQFIRHRFGARVARLVVEVTKVPVNGDRAANKVAERARLAKVSDEAQTLKLADLIDNTSDVAGHDPEFAAIYLEECRALLTVLQRGNPTLHKRASRQVAEGLELLAARKDAA